MERLHLVVARGRNVGARVAVEDAPRSIGRAQDADLVLSDPRVSRRHLTVRARGEGALLEACEGAAPFLVDGTERTDAAIALGDTIVVGDTALVLKRLDDAAPVAPTFSTELGALLTGLGADVRGVAAAIELVEALDAVSEERAIGATLAAWGANYVGAVAAELLTGDQVDAELRAAPAAGARVLERPGDTPDTVTLLAAAGTVEPAWIALTCRGSGGAVTDTTRRFVALAARLCASTLARVREIRASREEQELFRRASLGSARSFLGDSEAARNVAKLAARLASSDVVVLLEGETGVGKTFLARIIHESGPRAKEPLRVLNCAAIPEALLESELFGHERGAFTGAATSKPGALEAAGRGTVLLDEVGELPLVSQAKLLRVLEDKRFERLGSNRAIPLEARVLAATNRDLGAMVEAGEFRADLFYRLAVVKLRVPALRERGDDLVLLAERILADLAASAGRRVRGFSAEATARIRAYSWPGNVRELRNAIERAVAIGEGATIEARDLPDSVLSATPVQPGEESLVRLPARLDWLEDRAIEAALKVTKGNHPRAAAILGINRATLHRKLKAAKEPGDEGTGGG